MLIIFLHADFDVDALG